MNCPETFRRAGKNSLWLGVVGVALQFLAVAPQASALPTVLSNANTQVTLDTSTPGLMSQWAVDGINILNQQSFYFRNGAGLASPVSSLGSPTSILLVQPDATSLSTTYTSAGQFSLTAVYTLVGGTLGSGTADLSETIRINNLSGSALDFHFFQYANWTAGQASFTQNAQGLFNEAFVGNVTESLDTGVTPGAPRAESLPTSLANLQGTPNFMASTTGATSGNLPLWLLEWDKSINVGGSFILSKDLNGSGIGVVPEPPAWSLVSLGLAAFGAVRFYFRRARS